MVITPLIKEGFHIYVIESSLFLECIFISCTITLNRVASNTFIFSL